MLKGWDLFTDSGLSNHPFFRDSGEAPFFDDSDEYLHRIEFVHIASLFLYGMYCIAGAVFNSAVLAGERSLLLGDSCSSSKGSPFQPKCIPIWNSLYSSDWQIRAQEWHIQYESDRPEQDRSQLSQWSSELLTESQRRFLCLS